MKRISIYLCGITLFAFSALAQESQVYNNWFGSIGAGGSLICAEQDEEAPIGSRLKYSAEISLGKWFNPFFGISGQINYGALRGFNTFPVLNEATGNFESRGWYEMLPAGNDNRHFPKGDPQILGSLPRAGNSSYTGGPGFWQDFNYAAASVNLIANLTNLMIGFANEARPVELLPYIGAGAVHSFEGTANLPYNGLLVKAGLRFNFNISPSFAFYVDPQINITGEALDGHLGGRPDDIYLNGLLGFQITFNRSYASVGAGLSKEELDYINQRINENRAMIEENRAMIGNHQTIMERQQSLLKQLDVRVTDIENRPASVCNSKYLPEYVRFSLNSYEIPATERTKIEEAVNYLKNNPESKLLLIGYADKKTGSPASNMNLSKNRVQAIAGELKRQGVADDRLILQWKGDNEQPFTQNEWNRVVILVGR
ncbi:MAG: OmpA family protein [Dysgonamonadaceae bacterium]|jgi:outer membrane protein OmpA-like peptidoglycan-associated protein|nr:OmpA family protein [Dysgonamonadaceae bacterium]